MKKLLCAAASLVLTFTPLQLVSADELADLKAVIQQQQEQINQLLERVRVLEIS